ncbi:hypothetical protein RUM43_015058 [Polyplax serrata]|uniref:Uncharacterized protein n=1 Tax=Polyplax serrata TaxID=468196 RepID=A0AAN8RYN0_POLSC
MMTPIEPRQNRITAPIMMADDDTWTTAVNKELKDAILTTSTPTRRHLRLPTNGIDKEITMDVWRPRLHV